MSDNNGFNFRSGWIEPYTDPNANTPCSCDEKEDAGRLMAYICHPLSGDIRGNVDKVKEICMTILEKALRGDWSSVVTPVAPQLMFPTFADDRDVLQREWTMECCLSLVEQCDVLWVMVSAKFPLVTPGMRQEISRAAEEGIPIMWMDPITLEEI